MTTFAIDGTYNIHCCSECRVHYALTSGFDSRMTTQNKSWYCPNGHSQRYIESALQRAEKAAKRAQELLESERRRHEFTREERSKAERERNAERAAKSRIKNRVKHGVCPCCNRTFRQLADHMKVMHPEYVTT